MTPKLLFILLSQASVLIPVYAGIRNYKAQTRPFRLLFYFFVLSVFFEILSEVLRRQYTNNMPGLHAYIIVEFFAFSAAFYLHIQKNWLKGLMIVNACIFLVIAIIDMRNGIWLPNDLSRSYAAASIVIYLLGYLFYLFTKDDTRFMQEYPMFWICIGTLVYFATNYMYFFTNKLLLSKYINTDWGFHFLHAVLNIIANCLYAQSFKCLRKQQTSIPSYL